MHQVLLANIFKFTVSVLEKNSLFVSLFIQDFNHEFYNTFCEEQTHQLSLLLVVSQGPSIKDVRTLRRRRFRQKWTNADSGKGRWIAKCGRPLGKKLTATIFVKFTQKFGSMPVYKTFILLVFNRECMERNVMTLFRILSSFDCFLRYFQTRITTTKFDRQKSGTHIFQITTLFLK